VKTACRVLAPLVAAVCLSCGGESLTGSGTNPPPEAAPPGAKKPAGPKPAAGAAVVQAGLDVLETENPPRLKGKKVGLVANTASVTADLRWSGDVLAKHGVELVRLFTPEHGLRAQAADGAAVADGKHERTGLPIVSLYGKKRKPAPADLEGLDALVFDLQDAGVRFYTYVSTLMLCLDAAGEAGIELVVLDRPNPLGGERIEGPVGERTAVPESFVNMAPGPLVHGLTLGEMARFVNDMRPKPVKLSVVPMKGWSRAMTWADTGRSWVPPSPNLRDPDAVLAYPGVALLAMTNVSEGRGTETPFLLLGAPWIKTEDLLAAVTVPGFALEAATFTPKESDAAPDPVHEGTECAGARVKVTDAKAARPYTLGVALLRALRAQPGFEWREGGAAFDARVGTRRLREALERGLTVEAIVEADAAAIEAFKAQRKASLLY
jgi:beta-N-acetylhexosaminidase